MQIKTLFNPHNVAVIGASNDPTKVGCALMKNILTDSTREVFPITLNETEVLGHVAYTSINSVPVPVDLAVIAVRADIVPSVLRECAEKGIKSAIVISAGFKEMNEEGRKLEGQLTEIAKEHDIALLGPNCLGIMDAHANWNASFAVDSPRKGSIAFVSQSGALGTALLDWANKEGVGFSKFVSLGNEASLTELDFLEYLIEDEDTKAVLLYLEKVTDGARFLDITRRLTEKKPLVVLRAGRSARGSAAVASHTGSLAPSDKVFSAALSQAGAVSVDSLRTLFSFSKLFELGITKNIQNIAIVTNGGGPSVNTADLIEASHSLSLVSFSDEIKEKLRSVLPPMAAVGNPIDVIGDAGPQRYSDVLDILTDLPEIDAIFTLVTPQMMTDPKGIADVLVAKRDKKPIIPIFIGGNTIDIGTEELKAHGMVHFDAPLEAVESLDALARNTPKTAQDTVQAAPRLSTHLSMLGLEDMQTTLSEYGLTLEGTFVTGKEEVANALPALGDGPFAIKAISKQLVHKSDLRAVQLGLKDVDEIVRAWEEIEQYVDDHTKGAVIDGMLIQSMLTGVECIIGMKRDVTFGPTIVFGLGGIFVEILKDSSIRIAPVSEEEALKQIQEIKGLPLLTGARGRDPVDLDALAKIVVSLARLSVERPDIEEIDFNPVFATPGGAHIVDARIMIK